MSFRLAAKDRRRGEPRRAEDRRRRLRPTLLALEERKLLSGIVVNNPTDTPVTGEIDLRQAIDMANSNGGDEAITFDSTVFATAQKIELTSGQLELSNTSVPITIDGPGADALTIDAGGKSRVFAIDPGVTASISGLTVTGGSAGSTYGHGGDLLNQGTLTLTGATVRDGFGYGGGLFNFGTATLVDSTIAENLGNRGAGLFNWGTATLNDCVVAGNTGVPAGDFESASLGGGIDNVGSLTMIGGSVTGNYATYGSALYSSVTASVTGTEIGANPGPAEMIFNGGGAMRLADCTISGDSSSSVGGFGIRTFYYTGKVDLVDCTIEDLPNGGIINAGSTLNMTGCRIINNSGRGGLVDQYSYSNSTLTDCTVSGNTTNGSFVYGSGGGVSNLQGTLAMTDCTVSGNRDLATPSSAYITGGGGIVNEGTATLDGCTLSDNSALGSGGALLNGGTATLTNCTMSGNSASLGGGVAIYGQSSLVACTIGGNSSTKAGGGGGLYAAASTTTLTDSIVAGNTALNAQNDIAGAASGMVAGSYNLTGTGGSGGLSAANHNLLNVANPGLAPLGDYGGPTETIALQPDSPALHAGVAVPGVTTDQRGFPLDSPPDIGAFQSQPGPLVVDAAIDGLGSGLGQLSLRQAVNLADVLDGGDAITFDQAAFAGEQTITLTGGPLELSNATGPVSIAGTTAALLTVSGGGTSRVFQVDPGVTATLSNLTVAGGSASGDGGGVLNAGTLTLANVVVAGDVATGSGGGVANSGILFASNTTISGDLAADGGGLANSGTAVILGSSIDGDSATSDGGGVFNSGFLSLGKSDLSANSAGLDGGGLFDVGTATLFFCTVDSNSAASGGGIFVDPSATTPAVLVGTRVVKNKGGNIVGDVIRR